MGEMEGVGPSLTDEPKTISLNYSPRPTQKDLHESLRRFNVILAHRRFGKTVFALMHLIDRALRCKLPMPRYAYIAPTYGQAKRVVWSYLKAYMANIPGVVFNEAELRADIPSNGARIMLLSAENPMALKGMYLDGGVGDEFGDMNPIVWTEVIRPTLADRNGWFIFIGTVKGQNHFWEMYQKAIHSGNSEWYGKMLKASETGIIPKKELESLRAMMSEEEYNQEFECDPNAGLVGAYFGKEMSAAETGGRITKVPWEPTLPVDTYWDLGMNDTTAVWFVQSVRNVHNFIDCYEVSGSSIPQTVSHLSKLPYKYDAFVMPHDVNVQELGSGRTRKQDFYSLGCRNIRVIPRIKKKMDSINAARVMFSKCYFDRVKCEKGLKALSNYMRKWDAKTNCFSETPLHNWASNYADAFQQFGMGCRDQYGVERRIIGDDDEEDRPMQTTGDMEYDPFDMDQFTKFRGSL